MSRFLIVGLGNPGDRYARTRHNIGFMALDRLAGRHGVGVTSQKFDSLYDTARVGNAQVVLLKPQTFMNRSGQAVQAAARFYEISVEQIIVLHDEIDLGLGKLRLKVGGGHGGHNGLRDIIQKTSSHEFMRVRMGIGRPEHGEVTDFVLGRFRESEVVDVDELIQRACEAVELLLEQGMEAAQNRFH